MDKVQTNHNPSENPTVRYTGATGEEYFAVRAKRRDPRTQRELAKLFSPFVRPEFTVVDFGCGTGGILKELDCRRRVGIEINEQSRREAQANGVEVFTHPEELGNEVADLVISNHALEHVGAPLEALRQLHRILKPGSLCVIAVPAEFPFVRRVRSWYVEPDQHLFAWNPLTLGNLMTVAGFSVERGTLRHCGYTRYLEPLRSMPRLMELLASAYALVRLRYHTFCVARKL